MALYFGEDPARVPFEQGKITQQPIQFLFLLSLVFYAYSPFGFSSCVSGLTYEKLIPCNLQLYPPCKTLLEYLYGRTRKTASKSSLKREEYRRKQRTINSRKVRAVRTDTQTSNTKRFMFSTRSTSLSCLSQSWEPETTCSGS